MEGPNQDPNSKRIHHQEQELDAYTIPSQSSWFSWGDIHETERIALKDFFDGSSITRTPKIYKEYRDFIISKHREDPSRRLTFTDVRKSLIGDVNLIQKVFVFLDKHGLINFNVPQSGDGLAVDNVGKYKVKIEEGSPYGVRVAASPNSLRPISVLPSVADKKKGGGEKGYRLPSLTSYSDVFGDLKPNVLVCGNCQQPCGSSGYYEYSKESFVLCVQCFKDGNVGDNKSVDDFKFSDSDKKEGPCEAVWTEAETLLLLESVLKHGDNWELVAQNISTKTKLDCITKLIELPFGEFTVGSVRKGVIYTDTVGNINSKKDNVVSCSEHQGFNKTEDHGHTPINKEDESNDVLLEESASKRQRVASISDAGSSFMKQVALLSSMVGPDITTAAAEAAVAELCDGASSTAGMFYGNMDSVTNRLTSPNLLLEPERAPQSADAQAEENLGIQGNNDLPLPLKVRAAVATALGAAAAHAKLLADQEEREIEHLVANIIETQVEKLQAKLKHFDELEAIMEKERTEREELQKSIIAERINILENAFKAGISKRWDHSYVKL